jgi:hypothetical protein
VRDSRTRTLHDATQHPDDGGVVFRRSRARRRRVHASNHRRSRTGPFATIIDNVHSLTLIDAHDANRARFDEFSLNMLIAHDELFARQRRARRRRAHHHPIGALEPYEKHTETSTTCHARLDHVALLARVIGVEGELEDASRIAGGHG